MISVIIPFHNTKEFLSESLGSVLGQTLQDIEVICVDDASTDGSPDYIRSLSDPRVKIISHESRKGVSAARNTGLDAAQGEFVYFMDSDDWIEKDFLESMSVRAVTLNLVQVTSVNYFKESFDVHGKKAPMASSGKVSSWKNGFYPSMEVANCVLPVVWLRLYRREWLEQSGLRFPESLAASEDYYFTRLAAVLSSEDYIFVDAPAYHYRIRKDSLSKDNSFDNIRAASLFFDELGRRNIPVEGLKLFYPGEMILDTEEKFNFAKTFLRKIEPFVKEYGHLHKDFDRYCVDTVLAAASYEDFLSRHKPSMVVNYVMEKTRRSKR